MIWLNICHLKEFMSCDFFSCQKIVLKIYCKYIFAGLLNVLVISPICNMYLLFLYIYSIINKQWINYIKTCLKYQYKKYK